MIKEKGKTLYLVSTYPFTLVYLGFKRQETPYYTAGKYLRIFFDRLVDWFGGLIIYWVTSSSHNSNIKDKTKSYWLLFIEKFSAAKPKRNIPSKPHVPLKRILTYQPYTLVGPVVTRPRSC